MVSVSVDQLFLSNMGFAILLRSDEDDRSLPIMIGAAEAQAIALCINNVEVPRPLTHDLFKNVLDALDCHLERMEVCGLKSGTFYARLILDYAGAELIMDSRPSDAIALALRFDAPIFVDQSVMDKAGRVFTDEEVQNHGNPVVPSTKSSTSGKKPQHTLTPLEVLKEDMSKAIEEERYEDCARLRDEISKLQNLQH